MLETTFLGHQGWMFATANARVLIDPLLVEPFGHNGDAGVVWPPRELDIQAMPPVDAVLYSHEHEDHFSVPSVNRISRQVPIYIPARSSQAMRRFLEEQGFTVRLLTAGHAIEIGDLRITCFTPDHLRHDEQDEWDTMPYLIQDASDGGSFFSPVDVTVSEAIEAQLQRLGVAPGLWGYANNVLNLSFQEQPVRPAPAIQPIIARFVAEHRRRPPPPHASLMCGGGFSFTGPRAWMNHVFFPLDSERLFESLRQASPGERFIVPVPGGQIVTDRKGIRSVKDDCPFLRSLPRDKWPDRTYAPGKARPETVVPASGRITLQAAELEELEECLVAFAEFLYGTQLFRALYSLTDAELPPGVRPHFAINAMSGEDDHVFEYDPVAGRFAPRVDGPPMSAYAAGLECFGSDLLEFLRGRLAPSALMFGRAMRCSRGGEVFTGAIDRAIWTYGHPLRHQARYLDLYRSILAREPADPPQVGARRDSAR